MSDDICEVVITAPDADWLADFTRRLVERRLAACGHIIPAIRSIYRWDRSIQNDGEARVALLTRASRVNAISEDIREHHPLRRALRHRAADHRRRPCRAGLDSGRGDYA